MVALDDGGVASAGLDDVGIDGALDQVVHLTQLLGLVLEDADELLADDLPLGLRVGHSSKPPQEPGFGVHPDKMNVPSGEGGFHFIALVLAHETVVHKYTGELVAHRLRQEAAATELSTPAGQARRTLPPPTFSRIWTMARFL